MILALIMVVGLLPVTPFAAGDSSSKPTDLKNKLVLSLALVKPLGLVGVALGTFAAMSSHTIYTVWYLSRITLHRPVWRFLLKLVCNLMVSGILINQIPVWLDITAFDIPGFFVSALKVSAIVFPLFVSANALLSIRIIKEEIHR